MSRKSNTPARPQNDPVIVLPSRWGRRDVPRETGGDLARLKPLARLVGELDLR